MARRPPPRRTPGSRATRTATRRPARRGPRAADTDAGREFQRLVEIMRRLRGPGGCPWDREQTLETLRPFVLEETYEVLQAIDAGDRDALRGEIGDFLFEGVFLAQICADEGRFTVADSIRATTEKLVRRHPHVFGATRGVNTPAKVLEQWEQIKAREQQSEGRRQSVLGGLPPGLPALLGAHEIGTRVAAVGFDWSKVEDVIAKIREEVDELDDATRHESRARIEEEMGDLLFSIANLSRTLGVEPESALRKANEKFRARFAALEDRLAARGRTVHDATLGEMEAAWGAVKARGDNDTPALRPNAHDKTTKITKTTKAT